MFGTTVSKWGGRLHFVLMHASRAILVALRLCGTALDGPWVSYKIAAENCVGIAIASLVAGGRHITLDMQCPTTWIFDVHHDRQQI